MLLQSKFLSKVLSYIFWKESLTLATAESCTAGNIAAMITAIPGSSRFYKGGIIAYSDEVKVNILGVSPETLASVGAVSEETVIEMVKGAMKSMNSDCAVATSGIAGPTGGTPGKPVGTMWIAVAVKDRSLPRSVRAHVSVHEVRHITRILNDPRLIESVLGAVSLESTLRRALAEGRVGGVDRRERHQEKR